MAKAAKPKSTPAPAAKAKAKAPKRPKGIHVLTPYLVCRDAPAAIAFYKKAFGATEMDRMPGPDGRLINARLQIGGSSVMLMEEMADYGSLSPKSLKGTPVTIHLYVDDVDAFVARAVKAGAVVKMPVADMFWGDRYGQFEDPFGHSWSAATYLRSPSQAEMMAAMRKGPSG